MTEVQKFVHDLLSDMKSNSTKFKGHNPRKDEDIIIFTSLDYAQAYIIEFCKINNIDI